MPDDFLQAAWEQRVTELQADQQTLAAHLAQARATGDLKTAGDAIEGLNDVDARLTRLAQQRAQYEHQAAVQPQANRYGLRPEQQEAARVTGVDEETYARNLQELSRRKSLGMYSDGRS